MQSAPIPTTQTPTHIHRSCIKHTLTHTTYPTGSYQTQAGSYFEFLNILLFLLCFFCLFVQLLSRSYAFAMRECRFFDLVRKVPYSLAILDVECIWFLFLSSFRFFATRSCFFAIRYYFVFDTYNMKIRSKQNKKEICLARIRHKQKF